MQVKNQITSLIQSALRERNIDAKNILVEIPTQPEHGDYTTNIAFVVSKDLKKSPLAVAEELAATLQNYKSTEFEKIEAVKPGFINFHLSSEFLLYNITTEKKLLSEKMAGKRILVEYAHPNTHKEMHIGHMRTLITGEALCRLFESQGAVVFRANYQGDIGPHVAKAMVGIQQIMKEKKLPLAEVEKWSNYDKAHFLGEGYVMGNKLYDENEMKSEIDDMNAFLYQKIEGKDDQSSFNPQAREHIWNLYQKTHKWSMDYYAEFYARFMTIFDELFLESNMVECGVQIVRDNIGKIFVEDEGTIIFPGEKYGLHRRVFITRSGYPTYEGKEMCNGFSEYKAFPFDLKMHIVASEQIGYFQVVFKALELLDPGKFKDKQYHLPMGMVHLTDRKMSSRTGDILTVDWLIDQVKDAARELFKEGKISPEQKEKVLEEVAIGAVKYSVLKVNTTQDAAFDIQKSVSLDGDSGPYIQYTYARTRSILRKVSNFTFQISHFDGYQFKKEERDLLRSISQYNEVLENSAISYSPNTLCNYLFTLAKAFNNFYQKRRILDAKNTQEKQLRLSLVEHVSDVLKSGLNVLGIAAPQEM